MLGRGLQHSIFPLSNPFLCEMKYVYHKWTSNVISLFWTRNQHLAAHSTIYKKVWTFTAFPFIYSAGFVCDRQFI